MPSTRVLRGLNALRRPPARAVVTIGMFDGMHIAHQRLIRRTVALARRLRGTSLAITFDPDPQTVLSRSQPPGTLMPLAARLQWLQRCGIDQIWVIPFTRPFARRSALWFAETILQRRLRARALVVGEQFMFGSRRRGNMDVLRHLGSISGMRVVAVPAVRRGGAPVSSSRIRRLIACGQLADARQLLGRQPELYGEVIHGVGRGRRLGIPTANLRLTSSVVPPTGVYAVSVEPTSRRQRWLGVMNLGVRPTFGVGPLVCEVHLLHRAGRLYGRSVCVSLVARLRGERCFATPQALVRQIRHDRARARRLLVLHPAP